MQQIWFLIIGLTAGLLAGLIMKGNRSSLVGDMIVGVVGSYIGGMIFGTLSIYHDAPSGSFVAAIAGALVFVAVSEAMKKI
jgi:uncharacterized membrane protein YeaQ/YmgE (transglycosylase-associated protein family)